MRCIGPFASVHAHTDAATPAGGNAVSAGIGIVLVDASGNRLTIARPVPPHRSVNYLEHAGINAALETALAMGYRNIVVHCDNLFVVDHIYGREGDYDKSHVRGCKGICTRNRRTMKKFCVAKVVWISRAENQDAHNLARTATELFEEAVEWRREVAR